MPRFWASHRLRSSGLVEALHWGAVICAAAGVAAAAVAARAGTDPTINPDPEPVFAPNRDPGLLVGTGASRPTANRLVRVFHFEEPENPDPVPSGWRRAQDDPQSTRRPGFPQYNRAEFDTDIWAGDQDKPGASLMLPTRGGSTAIRLLGGELPVFPGADYSVRVMVRTKGLEVSRGYVVGRMLDQKLNPIPGSEVRSQPVLSENAWTPVRIVVPGNSIDAAWLQVDLELLQPRQVDALNTLPLPDGVGEVDVTRQHRVVREDVSGAAWFDEVAVGLVPRIAVTSHEPSGVSIAPNQPKFTIVAKDQGGQALGARWTIFTADGREQSRKSLKIDPAGTPASFSTNLVTYGWYRARLEIFASDPIPEDSLPIWQSEQWVGYVPSVSARARDSVIGGSPERRDSIGVLGAGDMARLGIVADVTRDEHLGGILPLLNIAHARWVVLPAASVHQDDTVTPPQTSVSIRRPILDALLDQRFQVNLSVPGPGRMKAALLSLEPWDAVRLLARDRATWAADVEPILDVYGQRIVRYQIGRVGIETGPVSSAEIAVGAESLRKVAQNFVPEPMITLATDLAGAPVALAQASGVQGATVFVPFAAQDDVMADAAKLWASTVGQSRTARELTIVPELPDLATTTALERVHVLTKQCVKFWNSFGNATTTSTDDGRSATTVRWGLLAPWGTSQDDGPPRLMPAPELVAMRSLAERLAGRRVIEIVRNSNGEPTYLLAAIRPPSNSASSYNSAMEGAFIDGAIVGWSNSVSHLDVVPTEAGLEVSDVFGNPVRAEPWTAQRGSAQVRVPLNGAPVFIENVDPYMTRFIASFDLSPKFVPAVVADHEHTITLTNPWPIRIAGQIQLRDPEQRTGTRLRSDEWVVTPNVIPFAIAAGETVKLPLTINFGPGQLAGGKDLTVVARVQADRIYDAVRMSTQLEIGLKELDLQPNIAVGPGPDGPDVVVTASVTNRDTRSRTLRLELSAPQTSTDQVAVSDLPSGQTVVKRFILRNAAERLKGRLIRVTLADDESAARLSKAVQVP